MLLLLLLLPPSYTNRARLHGMGGLGAKVTSLTTQGKKRIRVYDRRWRDSKAMWKFSDYGLARVRA